eukprot:563678-Amphidinium_carterae.1
MCVFPATCLNLATCFAPLSNLPLDANWLKAQGSRIKNKLKPGRLKIWRVIALVQQNSEQSQPL